MTNEQQQIKEWMQAFEQETPEKPVIPSLEVRKLRAKLILEEALETIKALGFQLGERWNESDKPIIDIEAESNKKGLTSLNLWPPLYLRANLEPNLREILDGCEDLKVVTEGTLVACGLTQPTPRNYSELCPKDLEDPAFNEVMRSNFSKLWTTDEVNAIFPDPDGHGRDIPRGWVVKFLQQEAALKDRYYLVKDSSGKVIKSPSYSPANLSQFIDV